MTYEEWDLCFKELESGKMSQDILNKMKNSPIDSLNDKINERFLKVIDSLIDYSINKIGKRLDEIFSDNYMLDLALVDFKNDIKYIDDLISLKHINENNRVSLHSKLVDCANKTYDILDSAALKEDSTGYMNMIIDNNRIKWS